MAPYVRAFLTPAKKFLTEELGSLKEFLHETLNAPSGRQTPKVIIDLPPPVTKEPGPEVAQPEQTGEIPAAPVAPAAVEQITRARPEPAMPRQSPETAEPEIQPAPSEYLAVAPPQEVVKQQPERKIRIFKPGKPKPAPPVAEAKAVIAKVEKPARVAEPAAAPGPVVEAVARAQDVPVTITGLMMGQAMTLGLPFGGDQKKCIDKQNGYVLFCAVDISWPEDIRKFFDSGVTLYRGSQAVVRYDGKKLTHAHALFSPAGLKYVVSYFNKRFGPPLETLQRIVTPFQGRPRNNPTFIWRKNETVDGEVTAITLEVRGFDDSRGGFPDMEHALVRLYGANSLPIFPHVSTMEMMLVQHALN